MSTSIYYRARRTQPLTRSEDTLVKVVVQSGSVNQKIQKYQSTGEGYNWESFCVYEKPESPEIVLEGATKLPDNSEEALIAGAKHWCIVLSLLRLAIPDAEWVVTIEDCPIHWNATEKRYDPNA
jgi:hypothetical protein